jgi:hypothetical protein
VAKWNSTFLGSESLPFRRVFLITTEAMVAELPKKAAAGPAMPPGGGMGGMDF